MSVTTPPTARGFSAGSLTLGGRQPPDATRRAADHGLFGVVGAVVRSGGVALHRSQTDDHRRPISHRPPCRSPSPTRRFLWPRAIRLAPMRPAETGAAASALLAAYAPDSSVVSQDMFASLFAMPGDKPEPPPPVVRPGDHWWAANPLPASVWDDAQQKCLAEGDLFRVPFRTAQGPDRRGTGCAQPRQEPGLS